jgi:hypothetical protein
MEFRVSFREKRKPGRNSADLSGKLKTIQEIIKPYRNIEKPTGFSVSFQEKGKPLGNSLFLKGIRKTLQENPEPYGNRHFL